MTVVRFRETSAEDGSSYKSYSIEIDNVTRLTCVMSRKTVWESVNFHFELGAMFEIKPARKLMNKTWLLSQDGNAAGTVELDGSACFAFDHAGNERFSIIDPRAWQAKLVETALNGWPDRYVIVRNELEVGQIARRLRPGEAEPTTRVQKLKGLFKPRDWTAQCEEVVLEDSLPLFVASMLLLIEVVDSSKRST